MAAIYRNWNYEYSYWQLSGNSWKFQFSSKGTLTRTMRSFPATSQRAKPKDLFMNATSRSVSSGGGTFATMNFTTNSGQNLYTDYPVVTMFPTSGTRTKASAWGSPAFTEPPLNISRAAMYNSIRNKIRGDSVNLGTMLGEYSETAETFLHLAKTVTSRGRNLIRRHPSIARAKRMVDIPSTAAAAHLQWTYGMKPLAQDLGQAVAEIKVGLQTTPPYLEGVVKRKDRVFTTAYRDSNSTIYAYTAKSELTREVRLRTQYRAYTNTNPLLTSLAAHGLLNPLSIAWELTPYSFVVDWFINVGDGIASLDNLILFSSLYVLDSTSTRTYEYLTPPSNSRTWGGKQYFEYSRSDVRNAPTTISMIVTPEYEASQSLGHIINGLALLQMARGRF